MKKLSKNEFGADRVFGKDCSSSEPYDIILQNDIVEDSNRVVSKIIDVSTEELSGKLARIVNKTFSIRGKSQIRILHVDDKEYNLQILEKKLCKDNPDFVLESAATADEALRLIEKGIYDCVITDYNLGLGKNGIDLLNDIKLYNPSLPVLVLTSQIDENIIQEAFRSGASDYFVRKVGFGYFQSLAKSIRNCVDKARAESQRRDFESLFKETVTISPVPMFLVDNERKIIFWNEACKNLTGFDADDVLWTSKYREIFRVSDVSRESMADLILDGKIDEFVGSGLGIKKVDSYYQTENYFKMMGARREFYFRVMASPVKDNDGRIIAVIEAIQDLTDILVVRRKIFDYSRQIERVAENCPIPICLLQDRRLQIVNDQVLTLLGYSSDEVGEMVGTDVADFVHPDDRERLLENSRRRYSGEAVPDGYSFRLLDRDKKEIRVMGYFTKVEYNGRPATLCHLLEIKEDK